MAAKKPKFTYELDNSAITLSSIRENTPQSKLPGSSQWSIYFQLAGGTLYVKNLEYNEETDSFQKALIRVRGLDGQIIKEYTLPHSVYKVKGRPEFDIFAVYSEKNRFYLYSLTGERIFMKDIKSYSNDKTDIRCIDFSSDGHSLLFTSMNKAYRMDLMGQIQPILVPDLQNWIYESYMSIDGNLIWLAEYGGTIYQIDHDGRSVKINYRNSADEPVSGISSIGNYQYVLYPSRVALFKNHDYLTAIRFAHDEEFPELKIIDAHILAVVSSRNLSLYTLDGQFINRLRFENPIYDVCSVRGQINVVTTYNTYTFEMNVTHPIKEPQKTKTMFTGPVKQILDQAIEKKNGVWVLEEKSEYQTKIRTLVYEEHPSNIIAEFFPYPDDNSFTIRVVQKASNGLSLQIPEQDFYQVIGDNEFVYQSKIKKKPDKFPPYVKLNLFGEGVEKAAEFGKALLKDERIIDAEFTEDYDGKYTDNTFRKLILLVNDEEDDIPDDLPLNRFEIKKDGDILSFHVPNLTIEDFEAARLIADALYTAGEALGKYADPDYWNEEDEEDDEDQWEIIYPDNELESGEGEDIEDDNVGVAERREKRISLPPYIIRLIEDYDESNNSYALLEISGPVQKTLRFSHTPYVKLDENALRLFILGYNLENSDQGWELLCYELALGKVMWTVSNISGYYLRIDPEERIVFAGMPSGTGDKYVLKVDYEGNVVERNPNSGYELLVWARDALSAGKVQEATELFKRALNTSISENTIATVYRFLGEISEEQGEYSEAIEYYQQAIEINPKVGVKKRLAQLLGK